MNFLLTKRPTRRKGEIGRWGDVSKHFLNHFCKKCDLLFEVFVSKTRKFCGTNFLDLANFIIFHFSQNFTFHKIAKINSAKNYSAKIYARENLYP